MTKKCLFEKCENALYAKGLCSAHYSQKRRNTELRPIVIKTNQSIYPCTFEGCVNTIQAKGLCGAHWRQAHLGKKLTKLKNQESIMERIMSNVLVYNDTPDGCWIWTGRLGGKRGYPQISLGGRQTMVHRIVFEEIVSELEPGQTIDHLCRNRLCVNPEHLEAITLRENVKRMHAYKSLEKENKKLIDFIESIGYDYQTLQKKG